MPHQSSKKRQIKEIQQKGKRLKGIISQVNGNYFKYLKSWNTLGAYKSFSFMSNSHSLHYMSLKVLSDQANKQPRPINNTLKIQRIFSTRIITSRTSYLLLFILIILVLKKDNFFQTKFWAFSWASCIETKKTKKVESHLVMKFHPA
jgi:hypothetical protein